jgi:hypothetical protein
MRSTPEGRVALGPGDLRLPGGRTPHEFLRTDAAGQRLEVRRFETVRPALTIELPEGPRGVAADQRIPATDLLVELDDRLAAARDARGIAKLERYDHLVAGWALQTGRYGRRMQGPPSVVFVCRDRVRARECARRADAVLTACRAYAGEYPAEWEYPGRERKFGDSVKKAE